MDPIAALLEEAAPILGPEGLIRDPVAIEPWLSDWRGRVHGEARGDPGAGSTEEVAAVVRLAAEHGVALVPQGGNTGMVAGAKPPGDGSARDPVAPADGPDPVDGRQRRGSRWRKRG